MGHRKATVFDLAKTLTPFLPQGLQKSIGNVAYSYMGIDIYY
jgi:hypothetical protein